VGRVAAVPRRPPFDQVADAYDRVRPGYPDDAVDALVTLARLPRRGRILEVGAGTGQLTVPLAERGYHLTAVEIGEHLAERLRGNVREYDDVTVICGRFEDTQLEPASFDLVTAAMAFHWLDRPVAYDKAAKLLRPTGALGLIFNIHSNADEGYFAASEEVYARHAPQILRPGMAASLSERDEWRTEIAATGRFGEVVFASHPWGVTYSRKTYLELLSTYSDHIALEPAVREVLFAELGDLIDRRFGGEVEKHYDALVVVAPVRPAREG
jgi:SAM-dependent methyltransferase